MLHKLWTTLDLLLRFLRAVAISGLKTVQVILHTRRTQPPNAALLRVKFVPMTETGAALLGCMVSLTPGTTTIDIDMEQHELLLHVLNATNSDALLRVIRCDFEPGLAILFGTRR
ncbi:MAG: Na+/H+ antiporter subunit E [Thiolinea sp.]